MNPPMQDRRNFDDPDRFGSMHSSGCQFVRCDGSVHSIPFTIDAQVFPNLGNRKDGQVVVTIFRLPFFVRSIRISPTWQVASAWLGRSFGIVLDNPS